MAPLYFSVKCKYCAAFFIQALLADIIQVTKLAKIGSA